jgi:hypothetical protein
MGREVGREVGNGRKVDRRWCGVAGAEICWLSLEHVWSLEPPSIPTTDGRVACGRPVDGGGLMMLMAGQMAGWMDAWLRAERVADRQHGWCWLLNAWPPLV